MSGKVCCYCIFCGETTSNKDVTELDRTAKIEVDIGRDLGHGFF